MVMLVLMACENESKIDYALFSGKIENPKGELITIYKGQDKIIEIKINDDGTFSDTLKIDTGYYSFTHNRENSSFYVTPGDELHLSLNTAEFDETIIYSGVGSENNNYLAAKFLTDEKVFGSVTDVYVLEESEFLTKINEIKIAKERVLTDAQNLDDDFRNLEAKDLEFAYLVNLQRYPSYHEYFAKKESVKVSPEFMKPLESVDFNNSDYYANIGSYKRLVQMYYSNQIKESNDPAVIFAEINKLGSAVLKDDLAKSLNYAVSPNNEHNEAYYNGIMAMSSNDELKTKLTNKYKKLALLSKGMPSPEFVDYENHKGGATSLKDLRGKYVYVDVWATWCGPCKREIPYLKEIEEQFHGKNIAFVSTSIDKAKDHNTWVEMVKDKELKGIQLFADGDWKSQFVVDYAIEGIPRFLLIDPKGNIVSADAPRPSNPKLVEMFNELVL
jgi:thiol-disulfide isomerase/thioredoxin